MNILHKYFFVGKQLKNKIMATYNSEDLMKATIAKFNEILNGGDKNAPANNQNFIKPSAFYVLYS